MTVASTKGEVRVFRDLDELSRAAADFFCEVATKAARAGDAFVALSGGSTPQRLYETLTTQEYHNRVPWMKTQLFWSDERCVPPDHPDSNYRMASEALAGLPISPLNVHRMRGEDDPEQAAREYEAEMRETFKVLPSELPRFDLLLLGLGEDGHTASLFPGTPVLEDETHLAASVYVEKLKSHRLTMTFPVINNAANVAFLVSGEKKKEIFRRLMEDEAAQLPAQKVRPTNGKLVWFADEGVMGR
jgi:6-phosphogluconolactonase